MAEMARVARTNTASLSRHSTWWTSSNVRGTSIIFAKQLHIRSLFFKEFRFQTISVSLWVTGSVNSTPHRARLTRATHTYVLVCTWLKMLGSCCSLVFLKNHSVSSMFHGTLLDAPFSPPFSTPFPTLAPNPMTTPSLLYPSASSTAATLQGGLLSGRLAEQSPLTEVRTHTSSYTRIAWCIMESNSKHSCALVIAISVSSPRMVSPLALSNTLSQRWKCPENVGSREIGVWALAPSVKIFSSRSDIWINSSSINQWLVSRGQRRNQHGRIGPFRVRARQER